MFYIYTWQAFIPYIKCWPRLFGSFFAFVPVFDKTRISIKKGFRIYCLFVTVVLSALLVYEFYKEVTSSTTYYRLRIITSTLQLISTSRITIKKWHKTYCVIFSIITLIAIPYLMYITLTENLSFKFRAMAACIHLMSTVQIVEKDLG
ncbi:unnamed protein product [Acanthoscelides obtectus]|uniref:Uncharacterized protein n=1 Tax=Acanthoscelides obtectus TaxID=200917 RepID=A0A9P0JM87_ACAOB|nr:unnamed protein product [Acanthoscelides obtectus]CAK1665628.1 hypothetical protein AOBTE_LOCUS24905 [Acanthoscelides obtectus]